MKKGKGKQKGHSSKIEEESEREDEEIKAMFAESPKSEREKWVQSVERRGFHCERGMKIETFLFTHPIHAIIQDKNFQFIGEEVKIYLPSIVREFYSNLRENLNADSLLETTISGKQLLFSPDSIARSLHYAHPGTHDRPYPLRVITGFDADLFANIMCTNPVPMGGFMHKEFTLGKLKPKYALMNKVIHNMIGPKGKDKLPSKEEIQFLYELINGKVIDYALVIWCVMRDFFRSTTENRNIPFPILVTNLVEASGIRGLSREKRVLPKLGPITSITEAKSRAASTRPQPTHPAPATSGPSSSSALGPMSTSPLKRMERRIKGWFKCIMGKQKQLDHRPSKLDSHILRGEPAVVDDHCPDLEGDSDELDDCVDENVFYSDREKVEEE